jgi:UDP-2,3-diacylglucosamine pyrophosphatase LpxH
VKVAPSRAFVPSYDELYSISDLHLGGASPGGQIFCQGPRVKAFLEALSGRPGYLCLVIAGDLFDSLPYLTGSGTYVAIDGAGDVLQTIMDTPAFAPVFEGLAAFLAADGRRDLVILIGNHDLEIALPEAQEVLLRTIAPTPAARGRVRFCVSGVGFRCQVGNQAVYVTHGNEADRWNHVDHDALRRAAHARALGQSWDARSWVPNAGTKLVIDAMNTVKAKHPFIDLLKPEKEAALKVLRTIDPTTFAAVKNALPAFASWARARVTASAFVLWVEGAEMPRELEIVSLLGDAINRTETPITRRAGQTGLMERVGHLHRAGKSPAGLVVADTDANLGYISNRLWGASPVDALRQAVQEWLVGDRSFELDDRDETYREIAAQVGPDIDVVITGHTHLPRWIDGQERGLTYLNAGAWARTMAMRQEFLGSEATFKPVYEALLKRSLVELDTTKVKVGKVSWPLILDATAAAHVADGVARLVRIKDGGKEVAVSRHESVLSWQ